MPAYRADPPERHLTIDEFERLPEDHEYRYELVRGKLVREPHPGPLHGMIDVILGQRLNEFARARGLGAVFSNTGYVLKEDPPTARLPDLSFVSRERFPPGGIGERMWHIAPDLAVEILSPSNTAAGTEEKIAEYLEAGCRLVWVIDPRRRSVTVHRPGHEARTLHEDDVLDGGEVLPGFRLPLAELFTG